ncbi:hypothetical protein EVA_21247, partial [gut metagenome]
DEIIELTGEQTRKNTPDRSDA